MSRISFKTRPQFSRRSVSFLSAAASGKAMARARREDIMGFNIKSPRVNLSGAIPCSEVSGRNPRSIATLFSLPLALHALPLQAKRRAVNYTFPGRNLPAGGAVRIGFVVAVTLAWGILAGEVV